MAIPMPTLGTGKPQDDYDMVADFWLKLLTACTNLYTDTKTNSPESKKKAGVRLTAFVDLRAGKESLELLNVKWDDLYTSTAFPINEKSHQKFKEMWTWLNATYESLTVETVLEGLQLDEKGRPKSLAAFLRSSSSTADSSAGGDGQPQSDLSDTNAPDPLLSSSSGSTTTGNNIPPGSGPSPKTPVTNNPSSGRPPPPPPPPGGSAPFQQFINPNPSGAPGSTFVVVNQSFDKKLLDVIKSFKGNILEYPNFISLFDYAIGGSKLPDSFKLEILKTKLSGTPYDLIHPYRNSRYKEARTVLDREYFDSNRLMGKIITDVQSLPKASDTSDLRSLERVLGQLRPMTDLFGCAKLDESFQHRVCGLFQFKFPKDITREYQMANTKLKVVNHKLQTLLSYVEPEIELLQNEKTTEETIGVQWSGKNGKKGNGHNRRVYAVTRAKRGRGPTKPSSFNTKLSGTKPIYPPTPSAPIKHTNTVPCTNPRCQLTNHAVLYCHKFPAFMKYQVAVDLLLCLICLTSDHTTEKCSDPYKCYRCQGRHSKFICNQRPGYYAPRPQGKVFAVEAQDRSEADSSEFGNCLDSLFSTKRAFTVLRVKFSPVQALVVCVNILLRVFVGLIDTGADVNLFPTELAYRMGYTILPTNVPLETANEPYTATEKIIVPLRIGNIVHDVEFLLCHKCDKIILGLEILGLYNIGSFGYNVFQYNPDTRKMHKLPKPDRSVLNVSKCDDLSLTADEERLVKNEVVAFKGIFSESGKQVGLINTEECAINLKHDRVINIRPYRVSEKTQTIIDSKIKELKEMGIIRDSTSGYSFPVVLASKSDDIDPAVKGRLCVNFQKLNEITEVESFPLPTLESIFDRVCDAKYFTTLDIANGFYHVKIREQDIHKTAFTTANAHVEMLRMGFGLRNAPIIFQRMIFNLLLKYVLTGFCLNFIDDILIFSKTFQEHLAHIRAVFTMVHKENIILKLSKCKFGQRCVKYLGYMVSHNIIRPLQSNTLAIEGLPPPVDVTSLRSFLGKVNYYQRFIENRAALFYPLYQLLRKNVQWDWDSDCQAAFERVKRILTSAPVLKIFHPDKPIFLYTDASRKGLGAVLKQCEAIDAKDFFVVGYFSRPLHKYQMNYGSSELELLSIVESVKYWHYYLVGRFFTIVTDHQPLKAVQKFTQVNTRLFNWSMNLSSYNFIVVYRPGVLNQEADYLSRHPVEAKDHPYYELKELVNKQALWICSKLILKAQETLQVPRSKRVFIDTTNGVRRIFYRRGDVCKDYLPDDLTEAELTKLHRQKGHIGSKQLELQFVRKYYNPNLQAILRKIKLECSVCLKVKKAFQQYGSLGCIGPAERPFDIIHVDTKGGLKAKYGSNKDNLHVAICAMTRFVWIVPSKTKVGKDFINLLHQILVIQKPLLLVSDNFPSFKGKEFQNFLKGKGIQYLSTGVNTASSNGIVERVQSTLVSRLSCKVLEQPNRAWPFLAKQCVDEYNSTVHTVTEYPPRYLLTGEDPEDLYKDETLDESRVKAFERSWEDHVKNAKKHDKRRIDLDYQVGDQVMVQAKHRLHRDTLEPLYEGPFEIKGKLGHTGYEIERNGKLERFHTSKFKPTTVVPKKVRSSSPTPISSLVLSVLIFVFLFGVCFGQEEGVKTTDPLLWVKTNNNIAIGYNLTFHSGVLLNPCTGFAYLMKENNLSKLSELTGPRTCQKTYETEILDYIHKHCTVSDDLKLIEMHETHHGRKKRQIGLAVAAAGMVGGLISYGILGLEHKWSSEVTGDDVAKIQREMASQLAKVKHGNELAIKYEKEMLDNYKENWHELRHLEKLEALHDRENKAFGVIMGQLRTMQMRVKNLITGFEEDPPVVPMDYEILWPGNPVVRDTPTRLWKVGKCQFRPNDTITMTFEIPILSKRLQVLKANPFVILANGSKGEECALRFTGNPYVVHDKVNSCTRDLLSPPLNDAETIFMTENHHTCIDLTNRTKDWNFAECRPQGKPLGIYTQIKRDERNAYVYCFTRTLKVDGQNQFTCRNVIYEIPKIKSFLIDDETFKVQMNRIKTEMVINYDLMKLINHRTFLPETDIKKPFTDLSDILVQREENNEEIKWETVVSHPASWISFSSVVAIIFAVIILCAVRYVSKNRTIRRKIDLMRNIMRPPGRGDREIPLTEIR